MALSTFIMLHNYHHHPSPELILSSQTDSLNPLTLTAHSVLPQPLAATVLLSVSINLTTLGTVYK